MALALLLSLSAGVAPALITPASAQAQGSQRTLPYSTVFKGEQKFYALVKRAEKENWRNLELGDRTVAVGLALVGTPYVNYTLEIDDHVEAASVNLDGLDCWTFFEASLGFARMLRTFDPPYKPQMMLQMVEMERYRGGRCTGNYLSRLHHLEDWMDDNRRRGLIDDITRDLGGVSMGSRNVREMQVSWKSYRYLRNNPELRPGMAKVENRLAGLKVYHVPKSRVPSIEKQLRSGDIISITSIWKGGYTSHVGIIYKDRSGVARFMHASSKKGVRSVLVDSSISRYLNASKDRAGIMVARPNEIQVRQYAER